MAWISSLSSRLNAFWQRLAPGYDLARSVQVLGGGCAVLTLWVAWTSPATPSAAIILPLAEIDAGDAPPAAEPGPVNTAAADQDAALAAPPTVAPPTVAPMPAPTAPAVPALTAGTSLPPAPDLGLISESPHGFLPIIGADGRRPADAYARPSAPENGKTRVGLVIRGLGLSPAASDAALNALPPEVTFAVSPFADAPQRWVNRARARGHEVVLDVPLEPFGYPDTDPGPHTLLTRLPIPELLARLHRHLAATTGYIGVFAFDGGAFLANAQDLAPVFQDLASRGLTFIEDGSDARRLWQPVARDAGLLALRARQRLDDHPSRRRIDLALLDLEKTAHAEGGAIAIGHALPVTMQQITAWLPTLESKGLVLTPVSAMMPPSATTAAGNRHVKHAAAH